MKPAMVAGMCEPDWIALRFAPVFHILLRGPYPSLLSKPSIRSADERFSICQLRQINLPRFQMKKPSNFVGGLLKILVNRIGFEPMACCLEGSCSIQLS